MTPSRKPESNNVGIMILGLDTRKHALAAAALRLATSASCARELIGKYHRTAAGDSICFAFNTHAGSRCS